MEKRSTIIRTAISGMVWGGIGIGMAVAMLLAGPGESLSRIGWAYRGGVLAAPFIGIAIGHTSKMFGRARFPGRAAISVITLYIAAFLFLLASQAAEFLAGELQQTSVGDVISYCWNATILGLTWTGFVFVLAPLAYVNHLLVSRTALGGSLAPRVNG